VLIYDHKLLWDLNDIIIDHHEDDNSIILAKTMLIYNHKHIMLVNGGT